MAGCDMHRVMHARALRTSRETERTYITIDSTTTQLIQPHTQTCWNLGRRFYRGGHGQKDSTVRCLLRRLKSCYLTAVRGVGVNLFCKYVGACEVGVRSWER